MIDWQINIGNILQIVAIIGGGLMVLWTLRYDVRALKEEAVSLEAKIGAVQTEIKKLTDIMVSLATINGKIETLDTRITATEQDIRELRHGDGFIRPRP